MAHNAHFETAPSWQEAEAELSFRPRIPGYSAGFDLRALRVHVGDHKLRKLPVEDRTLEAHYGAFVLSQSWHGNAEARRRALELIYGPEPIVGSIRGHEARFYDLGPEPPPGDIDPQSPAVVVWHDAGVLYLVASTTLARTELERIGLSLYE